MLNNLITSLITFLIALVPNLNSNISSPPNVEVNQTTIIFTGDIMLGRSVMGEALDNNDPYYPFRKTFDVLKNADITFANLENPIVTNCPRVVGGFKFCTSPEIAQGLRYSGIDIVTLANNHTNNYGKAGFEETKKYLTDMNISYVGDNNLEIIEKNLPAQAGGTKFGFLGFNYTFGIDNLDRDLELIKSSDPLVDVLIVENHWGDEYHSIANNLQTTVAHKMVEHGADVIIGNHPHWVQNYEEYIGKPIYYSLGNFIFDQSWSEETKKGLVVKMTFDGKNLVKKEEFKTYTPKKGQPEILQD